MAQSGYTPILIYGSGTASNIPSAANLTSSANGAELALNYADGKLYYKNSAGTVTLLADKISVSVASANGFAGSVSQATATSTPAITLSTSVTGVLVGNGTAVAAAVSGTDFKTINSTSILGSGNISITTTPGGSTTQVQYNNAGAFGGSANFVWDNSNVRLGIGTSSPAYALEVVGSVGLNTSGTSVLATFGANNTTDKYLRIRNSSGHFEIGTSSTVHYLYGNGAIPLISYTNGTERMRIDSSGNVGIGTNSPTELLQVNGRIKMGTNYIVSANVGPTFYISPTGSDTTGNGSNGNPWATLNKALGECAKFTPWNLTNATIIFKNGTYTLTAITYICGFTGGGTIQINAETAGSVTVNINGYQYEIVNNDVRINFSGITFQTASTPAMFNIYETQYVYFDTNCAFNQMVSSAAPAQFNSAINVSNSGFTLQGTFTVVNEASYGAVVNIYGNSTYSFGGTFTKSGARHSNAAISIQSAASGGFSNTINNFAIGINLGQSHYDAELFGIALANGLSLTNCTIGIRLSNNGVFKNYYIASTSGTTTPVYWVNGWYSGQYGSEYVYVGYNTSVSSSYRLQVNSQIYATNSTIATSDGRYKTNVESITDGLALVKALRPVQFDWIPHDIHNFDLENKNIGFIAQEVKEALANTDYVDSIIKPHYITREAEEYETIIITPATEEVIDEHGRVISLAAPPVTEKRITKPAVKEEFYGIAEGNLIALLTKAIQEQQEIIEALTARVEMLEAK